MPRKHGLIDADGNSTGNSWISNRDGDEEEEGFRSLFTSQDDGCTACGFEGPLRSTRKGYKCPKCRTLVIPSE